VRVISNKALREFGSLHPDANRPLQAWRMAMEQGFFQNFADLKCAFGSVDRVGDLHIFNIGGNKYRLIAYIRFDWQRCYIKHVFTHAEYERGGWKR